MFKNNFLKIIKISRLRFWVYLWGSYLLGFTLGIKSPADFIQIELILSLLYFSLPANLLIYAVNDYADEDTDQFNKNKKGVYEFMLKGSDKKFILVVIKLCLLVSLIYAFLLSSPAELLVFSIFLALSIAYSLKPFRFKVRPFIDSASNILYILPGVIGYYQSTNSLPPLESILIIGLWTSAMHLFSAIPDIESDLKANLKTSAVVLGYKGSFLATMILWGIFSILLFIAQVNTILVLAALVYPLICLIILLRPSLDINRIYRIFPYINLIFGALSFVVITSGKLVF